MRSSPYLSRLQFHLQHPTHPSRLVRRGQGHSNDGELSPYLAFLFFFFPSLSLLSLAFHTYTLPPCGQSSFLDINKNTCHGSTRCIARLPHIPYYMIRYRRWPGLDQQYWSLHVDLTLIPNIRRIPRVAVHRPSSSTSAVGSQYVGPGRGALV
ncbi:hypothetical protein GGS23DRAFT_492672 [Durotheca rogersii]|uniref:uncharacterized protein n=1 Tax=Durotheca rogersii TaxID=419775 RepID=UPI00221FCC77|nr:uncharacterized protein GGS23DRAFT_492672 [Durotheca rogersii]KAI5864292.1 hypothetical protein GGS23DRAFT_492672 [Durotheca rogersii]